jgi:hypothetical protein
LTAAALELEPAGWLFYRQEQRRSRLKRLCDCGHWIDGTEPYRYQVGRIAGERRLWQRLDCEFCARADNAY